MAAPTSARQHSAARARSSAMRTVALLCVLIALQLLVAVPAGAAREPAMKATAFSELPSRVSYFDDSSIVLWHDAVSGLVYRSADEGRTFSPVDGVPAGSAYLLIEHPYNARQAYILSNGKDHWRTTDRGATWHHFSTPDPPAVRAGLPLEFHADERHYENILYTGRRCSAWTPWQGSVCHDVVYYTQDAFASGVKPLMEVVLRCTWAKATPELKIPAHALPRILCIAWDDSRMPGNARSSRMDDPRHLMNEVRDARSLHDGSSMRPTAGTKSRLFQSDDFFRTRQPVDVGVGRSSRAFVGLGASRGYLITALQDATQGRGTEMALFISTDGTAWQRAHFPHGQAVHENAYTVLDGPPTHLLVDVLDAASGTGTLYASDSSGTQFVRKLSNTQRNVRGTVDYEHLANIEGVALANVRVEGAVPRVRSQITHDEGSTWQYLRPPEHDVDGRRIACDVRDPERCALHLHSATHANNIGRVFSSTAPGLVMGIGSVGETLRAYEDCDTFLSTDAGVTWRMVARHPHKYQFGDQGGLLVMVPDDGGATHEVRYSFDYGRSWASAKLPSELVPFALTTIPDGTALKFLLIGSRPRRAAANAPRHSAVFIDFVPLGKRRCGRSDFEKWYARAAADECLMGRRQWYMRRKPDADCVVQQKFRDPESHADTCRCTERDYECDFGFTRGLDGRCERTGPEHIAPDQCQAPGETYLGSSGYRRIPGDSCTPHGTPLDERVRRPCRDVGRGAGAVVTRRFHFPSAVADVLHFDDSPHVLVRLLSGEVFQSANDGSTWRPLHLHIEQFAEDRALAIVGEPTRHARAYIITERQNVYYTRDAGSTWRMFSAPLPASRVGVAPLVLDAESAERLLWVGSRGCPADPVPFTECRTELWYSTNHGLDWTHLDDHVRECAWLRPGQARMRDGGAMLCESFRDKRSGAAASPLDPQHNPLQLVLRTPPYKRAQVLLRNVLGFSVFGPYVVAAEVLAGMNAKGLPVMGLHMLVSEDGQHYAAVNLPQDVRLDPRAYTVLTESMRTMFLHVTTHAAPGSEWGAVLRSNSNGTDYIEALPNVNRDSTGLVDFELLPPLGVLLSNVVANREEAAISAHKQLATRISHSYGAHWEALTPPAHDANGNAYACQEVGCDLHLHGLTSRPDERITTGTPSAGGFLMGVGSVGRALAPYRECDMFLSRDAGFTWQEVHKDAHKWVLGDKGSVILLVNDEQPTDAVLYSLDQGHSWTEHRFGERLRLRTIDNVHEDQGRRFVLFGQSTEPRARDVAVFVDLSALTPRECVFDEHNAERSDFEHWSPTELGADACLFGQELTVWRRKRDRNCVVGNTLPETVLHRACACSAKDFECEFNHYRDPASGECVQHPGTPPLTNEQEPARQCWNNDVDADGYWYERTNVRKVASSRCAGGARPDRGRRHRCPRPPRRGHGVFYWLFWLVAAGIAGGAAAHWWQHYARDLAGHVRLPDTGFSEAAPLAGELLERGAGALSTAAGVARTLWARVRTEVVAWLGRTQRRERPFTSYHVLSTDEDAEVLHDYDSEELENRL